MTKGPKKKKIENPAGGRSLSEWVGKTPDAKVPDYVRLRLWRAQNGMCALTGVKLGSPAKGKAALDHIKPLVEGGAHAESNLRWIAAEPHKEKTKREVQRKAKADRSAMRETGIYESTIKIKSRGFEKVERGPRVPKPIEKKAPKPYTSPFAHLPRRVCGIVVGGRAE